MKEGQLKLGSRIVLGGIAGFVGTLAMTAAMRRLHRKLPEQERYPLTPREIVDSAAGQLDVELSEDAAKDTTLAAHFTYGAATGSLVALVNPRPGPAAGAAAGAAVWLASYMGWIPAAKLLKPATEHPPRRNLVMIGAHLVWGAATAVALRELGEARRTIIGGGPDKDVPPKP